ncbi:unnamed protein product [Rangifer tarandus platyrhynchus]|uniref:Uncharacterized protein n=1 Tax=Rangifer tarandus platyrhynchus TaxID=3082113 RepID=A0AC59Z178_RANTA
MQEVIAGLERLVFAFEKDVETQKGTGLLPVRGMDKSGAAVCTFFAKGLCVKDEAPRAGGCPLPGACAIGSRQAAGAGERSAYTASLK